MTDLTRKTSAKLKSDCRYMPAVIREHKRKGRDAMAAEVAGWLKRTVEELHRRGHEPPKGASK